MISLKTFLESKILRGIIYQVHLQREIEVDDFTVGRNYGNDNFRRVNFHSEKFGLIVPVELRLENDALRVTVKTMEIVEKSSSFYRLMQLDVMPEMLKSKTGSDGFYILPVASGVKVDFRERTPVINRDRIYMEQKEWEKFCMMNCFAASINNKSTLGIITEGDFFCYITSAMNQNGANYIYPTFGLRHHEAEMLSTESCEVLYRFSGDIDYPQLAFMYRDWLMNEKGITTLKERMVNNPTLQYSSRALRVKIFMGMKYPFSADGSSPMQPYTTFEQAEEIIETMKARGIEYAVITLVGWNSGGHDGAFPTRFPVEPELGGEEGLRKLIAKAKQLGYQIVPHDNVTDIYLKAPDYDPEFVARTEHGEPLPAGIWGGGQSYKACPLVYAKRWSKDFERIFDLGFAGHYYMDAQSTVLWRCYDPKHPADERQFALALAALTQIPREQYGAVSVEVASSYCLPFIDEVAKIHSAAGGYTDILKSCTDELLSLDPQGIPFYQIALHGLILYQNNWIHKYRNLFGGIERGRLVELAFGARPSMEISYVKSPNGDYYMDSIDDIMPAYKLAFDEIADCHAELIKSFVELTNDVYCLIYENGTEITVNMSDSEYQNIPVGSSKIISLEINCCQESSKKIAITSNKSSI